jgi:hypothetical protein
MSLKDRINKAQAAMIARDDLVIKIAKLINPSAFTQWYSGSTSESDRVPVETSRQRYHQAEAIHKATEILKLVSPFSPKLIEALTEHEKSAWRDMLPEHMHEMIDGMVEDKHRKDMA